VQFAMAGLVEQTKLHFFRVFGKKRKVHALAIPRFSERIGFAGPNDQLSLDRILRGWA
jgi:hypothetical protein